MRVLTQEDLKEFIRSGGIQKIGHRANSLLTFLVQKAEENGYSEALEVNVQESMYMANIPNYTELKRAREKLLKNKCIKGYEKKSRTGFYYFNYDLHKK